MVAWDSVQYLRFERERTQASHDLVRRIALAAPRTIVDLGCGPGNSTRVLRERWPAARVLAVDSSAEMLETARSTDTGVDWEQGDIASWTPAAPVDLVFSNAALQWLPHHDHLVRNVWSHVGSGGALAFQVPAPGLQRERWAGALRAVLGRPGWEGIASGYRPPENVLSSEGYYDLLSPTAGRVDLWDTEYLHVLPGVTAVVEWVKGTALRPILARLPGDGDRRRFLSDLEEELALIYLPRPDGRVLFPFLRRFVIAYRP